MRNSILSQLDVARFVTEIDRERARLRTMLRSKNAIVLARRPPNGDIVENVRHLLFAEQMHLGAFLPDGFEWSPLGLAERVRPEFAAVGENPSMDIDEVFAEWDKIHTPIRKAMKSAGGDIERALWRNHRHLGIHIKVIEKLIRKWGA